MTSGIRRFGRALDRSFFERPATELAPALLNKLLVVDDCVGRIVEVEAYGGSDDPASHAFRGETPRNRVMFGPAGCLYVYFTYGMHFCCNVVAARQDIPAAVLIRAVEPIRGTAEMRKRRSKIKHDRDLTNGPAKLCSAMGIDRSLDGVDLVQSTTVGILSDEISPPSHPAVGPRIGIRSGRERLWRYSVKENLFVSKAR